MDKEAAGWQDDGSPAPGSSWHRAHCSTKHTLHTGGQGMPCRGAACPRSVLRVCVWARWKPFYTCLSLCLALQRSLLSFPPCSYFAVSLSSSCPLSRTQGAAHPGLHSSASRRGRAASTGMAAAVTGASCCRKILEYSCRIDRNTALTVPRSLRTLLHAPRDERGVLLVLRLGLVAD